MSLEYVSLGEVAEITKLAGFEFTKYIEYLDYGEIIALRALNLHNGRLDLTDVKYISKDVSESLPRSKLYKNDILLTYTGNGYGDCAIVTENNKYHLAPNIAKISPKKINPYFLFEYINSKFFRKQMRNFIGGSSQPTIPMKTLRILEVPFPDEETQRKVAEILLHINKRITINKKINKNLTNIALLLFKNWFVDFNFLNENNKPYKNDNGKLKDSILGLIPKDWDVDSLGKYVEIDRGFSYKGKFLSEEGIPLINLGNILPNSEFRLEKLKFYLGEFDKKYEVNVGDILVANTDLTQNRLVLGSPIIVPSLINDENIIYSHHINRLSNFKLPKFYIFYNLLSERYNHMVSGYATGTTVLAISKESISNYKILIPSEELLLKFDKIAKNIEKIKDNNLVEIKKLTKLRDILLPKLMAGEIDLSQLDYLNNSIKR